MRTLALLALMCAWGPACGGGQGGPSVVDRGRSVYLSNCTTCHDLDPAADAPLGPPVAGSSRELLEAKVVRGAYPPGYRPKRDTRVMAALPHLADQIDSLAAYLKAPTR